MFFHSMNPLVEKLLIGIFFFAIYWFILRRYNSLGLRLFVLFFSVALAVSYWIYEDEQVLKSLQKNGQHYDALVLQKLKTKAEHTTSADNTVKLSFKTTGGETIEQSTHEYISNEEYERFKEGKTIPVLYDAQSRIVYVNESLNRFISEKWVLYAAAAFFALAGAIIGIVVRKIKVGVDEETGDEYLEVDGKTMFDERKSPMMRAAKHANIVSKMFQAFGKG
ncbi:hypothetical protein [Runella sp.]|uniref:hypothetical protein n=1 Tax=Runella sp. TaxID=1960881 RepID=UPI003D11D003